MPEDVAAAFAEFELEPRDIIAVLEHYRARAAAGETASSAPSPRSPRLWWRIRRAITFTVEGASDEVRAQVCLELKGTLVLPRVQAPARVRHLPRRDAGGARDVGRDAGKGANRWKFTVRMVEPDGSVGKPFKMWMEQMGYYPKGTVPDAPPKKQGSLKEQRKQAAEAKKRLRSAPSQSRRRRRKGTGETPEKSFETQLENLLDEDGGVKVVEKIPNLVWLMKNVTNNGEKSLVITVIRQHARAGRSVRAGRGSEAPQGVVRARQGRFQIIAHPQDASHPRAHSHLRRRFEGDGVGEGCVEAVQVRASAARRRRRDAVLARRASSSAEKIKNRWQAAVLQEQAKVEEAAAAAARRGEAKEKAAAAEKKKRAAETEAAAAAKRQDRTRRPVSLGVPRWVR